MIRLLLDQGLPRRTVYDLRTDTWDVVHAGEIDMHDATDSAILDRADVEDRSVVTLDSDFAKILAARRASSPSVIHIRIDRLDRERMTRLLRHLIPAINDELQRGVIATVTESGTRIRTLPLP